MTDEEKKAKPAICANCHWWVRFGSVLGNCHRMPPTDKGFAVVHDSSFCGEFKAKQDGR